MKLDVNNLPFGPGGALRRSFESREKFRQLQETGRHNRVNNPLLEQQNLETNRHNAIFNPQLEYEKQLKNDYDQENNPILIQGNKLQNQGTSWRNQAQSLTNSYNQQTMQDRVQAAHYDADPLYKGLSGAGDTNELLKYAYYKQHPDLLGDDPAVQNQILGQMQDQLKANLANKKALGEFRVSQTNSSLFRALPANEKAAEIAQGNAMGLSPIQTEAVINSGRTMSDVAKELGYDQNKLPNKRYSPTNRTVGNLQNREVAAAELNVLEKKVSSALAPYSRKVANYSPLQVAEAIRGENTDGQARFLAARAIQPEIAGLRLKIAGGNVGITAIQEMVDASLGHSKVYEAAVSPEVYQKMNDYINDWIEEGMEAANAEVTQPIMGGKGKRGADYNHSGSDPLGLF